MGSRRRWGQSECGTQSGYTLHTSRGEKPCEWCRQAHNLYTQIERQAVREAVAQIPGVKASIYARITNERAAEFDVLRRAAAEAADGA